MPMLERVGRAPEGAEALSRARHLAAYYDAHATRPSFVTTIPPAGPPGRAKSG
jgi:glutathione S-transferase